MGGGGGCKGEEGEGRGRDGKERREGGGNTDPQLYLS